MKSSRYGYDKIVSTLIKKGAIVNQANKDGQTALMIASNYERGECINVLIREGNVMMGT